jgi:predicted Zn-dependent protease
LVLSKLISSGAWRAGAYGALLAMTIGTSVPASAQDFGKGTFLSDTEIDATLNNMARSMLVAGGLNPDNTHIGMIVDDEINAVTVSADTMFLNTGLLLRSRNANEVIGVIAHEAGHMAGGHTVLMAKDMAGANTISLLSTLLGIAVGVASGSPDAGMAIMMGGQRAAIGEYLSFSRGQESRADQFAIKALEDSHQSAQGFHDFFERLMGEELLYTTNRDPYVRTHPLNRERMATVEAALKVSHYTAQKDDPEIDRQYRRMIAKLFAFLKPQISTLQRYPESDKSIEGRYARAIAYYRRSQFDKALPLVDGLTAELPKDPYFWQIKGDMLLSKSKIVDAVVAYREAIKYLPDAPEILVSMSRAMVEANDPAYEQETEKSLKHALQLQPENTDAWDLLASSYAQNDKTGLSAYAAAERAVLTGQFGDVVRYTAQAEKLLEKDTPTWYRLQDIKITAQNSMREMRERRR